MRHLPARRFHTSGARLTAWLLALALAPACRTAPPTASQVLEEQADARVELERVLESDARPLAPGALRIRLAFHAEADLDLFVTDPLQETVYFANSPSGTGGRLERDVRCDDPAPRVETIVFPSPPPGRYRVGVDFPSRCGGGSDPVVFVVSIEHGDLREEQTSVIGPREFLAIVHEVALP